MSAANRKRTTSPKLSETAKGRLRRGRKKVCAVCADQISHVDYKDTALLRRFMSDRGKIKSRANTGTCVQHQSDVAIAIKNAREMALLPYVVRTLSGDRGGRRGRGPGAGRPRDNAAPSSPDGPPPSAGPAPASTDGPAAETDAIDVAPLAAVGDESAMALEGATAGQPED